MHIRISRWPLSMVCHTDATADWFASVREVLHWNERKCVQGGEAARLSEEAAAAARRQRMGGPC